MAEVVPHPPAHLLVLLDLAQALTELCGVSERHRAVLGALYTAKDPGGRSGRAWGVDFAEPFERLALDNGHLGG